MSSPSSVVVRAPAKVNLELRVGPLRADGFHDLATIFHAVSLFDDVTVTRLDGVPASTVEVTVTGTQADAVPTDESNLCVRAVRAMQEQTGVEEPVSVRIDKQIPVAGGMAGGSSNAAAALLACDTLWQTGLGREGLHNIAAGLGSDVPFALVGGTAVGTGRGDLLSPALVRGEYIWVIAVHRGQLSTPAVYREIDRLREGRAVAEPIVEPRLMQALTVGNPAALGAHLTNDLQPAACSLMPDLLRVLDVGDACGALGSLVSGSGPTVIFLAEDAEQAMDIEAELGSVDTVVAVHRATGPVPGAKVVSTTT